MLAERHGGRAYLYGSRARGDALPSSDVDVLIVVPNNVDRLKVLHQARRLVPNTLVEINVLNEDEAVIFMRLVKTVKPIKGEDKEPSWKNTLKPLQPIRLHTTPKSGEENKQADECELPHFAHISVSSKTQASCSQCLSTLITEKRWVSTTSSRPFPRPSRLMYFLSIPRSSSRSSGVR